MVGFTAGGGVEAQLPIIGRRWFADGGISCIDPSAQGQGLANAIGRAKLRSMPPPKPYEFGAPHFGTPVTLKAVLALRRYTWPGNSITEMASSLANPTSCQRAVGVALAEIGAATSYNADNWVMRTGQPAGASTTIPHDLEPEYAKIFAPVDRSKGDALLGIFWHDEPPPEWWT